MTIEEIIKTNSKMSDGTRTVINLSYTARNIEELLSVPFKDFDLSVQQYNVLRILRGQKNQPANLSTVQERMVDKNSNTTRLVDKLEKKNLVNRQICPQNRRKIELLITKAGLDLLEELDPITEQNNTQILKNFTETEIEALNNLLDKLRDNE